MCERYDLLQGMLGNPSWTLSPVQRGRWGKVEEDFLFVRKLGKNQN